jgi:hypothetical protein
MLSDEVASKVLGELHTLTKHLDEQRKQVIVTSGVVNQAADKIKQNAADAVSKAREAVYQAQLEYAVHFEKNMANVAANTLNKVAMAIAIRAATKWVLAGVVITVFLTFVSGAVGYHKGKGVGKADGYSRARDEVAAASWANTLNGKLAYQLSEAGSIEALATCDEKRGWILEKNICHPHAMPEGIYGWRIRK